MLWNLLSKIKENRIDLELEYAYVYVTLELKKIGIKEKSVRHFGKSEQAVKMELVIVIKILSVWKAMEMWS